MLFLIHFGKVLVQDHYFPSFSNLHFPKAFHCYANGTQFSLPPSTSKPQRIYQTNSSKISSSLLKTCHLKLNLKRKNPDLWSVLDLSITTHTFRLWTRHTTKNFGVILGGKFNSSDHFTSIPQSYVFLLNNIRRKRPFLTTETFPQFHKFLRFFHVTPLLRSLHAPCSCQNQIQNFSPGFLSLSGICTRQSIYIGSEPYTHVSSGLQLNPQGDWHSSLSS